MSDPRGLVKLSAGGREYRLWLGMSVLADLQASHGRDVFERLEPPKDAASNWVPELAILVDLFMGALQRYHAQEADRYLVDEILSENMDAFPRLMAAAFPDQGEEKKPGNRKARRAA